MSYSVTGMTWLTVNIKTTGRSYHQDNYADDNTVSCADRNLRNAVENLVQDSLSLIQRLSDNQRKANPEKFRANAAGKRTKTENVAFRFENNVINCDENVKLRSND